MSRDRHCDTRSRLQSLVPPCAPFSSSSVARHRLPHPFHHWPARIGERCPLPLESCSVRWLWMTFAGPKAGPRQPSQRDQSWDAWRHHWVRRSRREHQSHRAATSPPQTRCRPKLHLCPLVVALSERALDGSSGCLGRGFFPRGQHCANGCVIVLGELQRCRDRDVSPG